MASRQGKRKGGWKAGQSGNPKGRPSYKDALSKKVLALIQAGDLETPLKFMLGVLTSTDPHVTMKDRQWAAANAAPYCHRKMPIAIEGGESPIKVFDASKLAGLSPEELRVLMSLLGKLGAADD